jgi:hypothetical protein
MSSRSIAGVPVSEWWSLASKSHIVSLQPSLRSADFELLFCLLCCSFALLSLIKCTLILYEFSEISIIHSCFHSTRPASTDFDVMKGWKHKGDAGNCYPIRAAVLTCRQPASERRRRSLLAALAHTDNKWHVAPSACTDSAASARLG